jgi:hypothetical protein
LSLEDLEKVTVHRPDLRIHKRRQKKESAPVAAALASKQPIFCYVQSISRLPTKITSQRRDERAIATMS